MAAFAINSLWERGVFVFGSGNKGRIRVVATHALESYFAAESAVVAILKAGREIPFAFLGVKSKGHLSQVSVVHAQVTVGVLAAAHNEVNGFVASEDGILS